MRNITNDLFEDKSVTDSLKALKEKGVIDNNYLRNLLDSNRITMREYMRAGGEEEIDQAAKEVQERIDDNKNNPDRRWARG